MKKSILLTIIAILLAGSCFAADVDKPMQIYTTSWPGLTGLYIIPTARIIGKGNWAIGFNESKHTEYVEGDRFSDRHIRLVNTYGISDKLEACFTYYNNMYTIPPGIEPDLDNKGFYTLGLKLQLVQEDPCKWYPAFAIGVRDITDNTADTGSLENVNNGTKVYFLASKKILNSARYGKFMDVHGGVTVDKLTISGLLGFELTIAPNASFIAEGIWDAPYLNFRKFGNNDVPGRFLFNTGVRIYPEMAPGLTFDLGFIGDGEFEFSFGTSYVIHI